MKPALRLGEGAVNASGTWQISMALVFISRSTCASMLVVLRLT